VTPLERRVRGAIYAWLLGTSQAPDAATLAAAVGATDSDVVAALHRLAELHLLVLAPRTNDIWMAHPFAAIPTAFPVSAGGHTYYANCAWDAAGILSLTGDGSCTTRCGDCGRPMTFGVQGGTFHGDGVVHFAVPARRFWDDIGFT
jgi:hypothetical protein